MDDESGESMGKDEMTGVGREESNAGMLLNYKSLSQG